MVLKAFIEQQEALEREKQQATQPQVNPESGLGFHADTPGVKKPTQTLADNNLLQGIEGFDAGTYRRPTTEFSQLYDINIGGVRSDIGQLFGTGELTDPGVSFNDPTFEQKLRAANPRLSAEDSLISAGKGQRETFEDATRNIKIVGVDQGSNKITIMDPAKEKNFTVHDLDDFMNTYKEFLPKDISQFQQTTGAVTKDVPQATEPGKVDVAQDLGQDVLSDSTVVNAQTELVEDPDKVTLSSGEEVERDLEREQAALAEYGAKYGKMPETTVEWQQLHDIAYKGEGDPGLAEDQIPEGHEKIAHPDLIGQYEDIQRVGAEGQPGSYLTGRKKAEGAEGRPDVAGATAEQKFVDRVNGLLDAYGVGIPNANQSPVSAFSETYKQLYTDLGLDTLADSIKELTAKSEELDNELAEQVEDINDNPWLSEALRTKKINNATAKIESKKAAVVDRLQLEKSLFDSGQQEARFVAEMGVNLSHRQEDLQRDIIFQAIENVQSEIEASRKMSEVDPSTFKSVQGGLFNIKTGEWVVRPKATGSGSGTNMNKLLSISEAEKLGLPYGTTRAEAAEMGVVPGDADGLDLTDEEKQFQKDLNKERMNLAQGGSWGESWDTLKAMYPDATNEDLDELLNKEKYFEQTGEEAEPTLVDVLDQYKSAGWDKGDIKRLIEKQYGFIPEPAKKWLKDNF